MKKQKGYKTRKVDRIDLKTGGYILNAEYVDYGDGAGEQVWSGMLYNNKDEYIGHADPPGPRGTPGSAGLIFTPLSE